MRAARGRYFRGVLPGPNALEERVGEDTVVLGGAVQCLDTGVEAGCVRKPGGECGLADSGDHRGKGFPDEAVDEVASARVDIDHAGRDAHRLEARPDHQRVDLPADEGVPAGPGLQLDLALDRRARGGVVGVEEGRPVVALDDSDGPAPFDQGPQRGERLDGSGEMLEDEA